ncbi:MULTISPECIES: hypothetical protein [Photobacterium]|uniref:YbbD head domain-containing protein n=1 Tax=Photobacterium carnosum TaxID=2023717 RepID=A0A2N4UPT9_9GAMM|nr:MULTISPECIES: hypothetical protein [Photobacterium]MBY3788959.1 hypothetical protein [Photobacterium carnosum]MCD9463324.1 hypothetical protein [Photobacterium phosphoreum]MCD9480164.1 hypothetical protein [Photobacterium phosphoreum]MCD9502287.1 hypothetical protein [Photobacterium phosphoreum]MCD9512510.1 hypothetical protein [Photobacterium phosphoreum]
MYKFIKPQHIGCSEAVTNKYVTYAQAKEDKLFERGWLPNILPESTTNIVVTNDLDSNRSMGEFIIEVSALPEFLEKVKLTGLSNQYRFVEGSNAWVFIVNDDGFVTYELNEDKRYH